MKKYKINTTPYDRSIEKKGSYNKLIFKTKKNHEIDRCYMFVQMNIHMY